MPKLLTDDQITRYRRDGFVFPVSVLTPDEVVRFRTAFDALEESHQGRVDRDARSWIDQPHLRYRWGFELASNRRVLDAVEDLIGPDLLLTDSKFFPKPARSEAFVSWHQDNTYVGYAPENEVVTVWIGLTDSTAESGCVRMIPGSDRAQQPHVKTFADHNLLSRGQAIVSPLDEERAVPVLLAAGEMSMHNLKIVHGSSPNRTDTKRVGIMIGYVSPRVTTSGETRYPAVLVRGRDGYGHFEPAYPPGPN